ncbi:cation:proton antiporter [Nonomuraea sp. SYSU D8015]|uniref:cation:proton antiporter n=1 Tax=Nonomuraea sp. SYSU D8015 TaxID=2593644 RepID=UPI00166146B9|nr:cation:proton antiporter [Nonomuraea sp. SYSU D8015]
MTGSLNVTTIGLCFAAILFIAVLISGLARRTVLSTAGLFLGAGFLLGGGALSLIQLSGDHEFVRIVAELALFSVLFTDGMHAGFADLRQAWRLPGRALILGMPLTFAVVALLARYVAGLDWPHSLLIGAVLAPTDPVFAAALIGRPEVPQRVRHLLNVESGLNDGLALPVVIILIGLAGHRDAHPLTLLAEVGLGIAVGFAVALAAVLLTRLSGFEATAKYEPFSAFAVALLVLTICAATHANMFLGAFTAGVTIATFGPELKESFQHLGEEITELLKLLAVFVFAALLSLETLAAPGWQGWVFAILVLVLARPMALLVALTHSPLTLGERLAVAWFGPKGFASVVYAIIVLGSGVPLAHQVFALSALAVALSILAHSSTDVLVARRFQQQ